MKILKKIDTSTWSHRTTCSKCDTELEANRRDIKCSSSPSDFRDPGYDNWYVICPICGNIINIPENKIPKALQVEIKQRKE